MVGKVGAYKNEATFRWSTQGKNPGLTQKFKTRLEWPAREKRSSLLQTFVNYVRKKFNTIGALL